MVPILKNPTQRIRDHAYHAFPKQRNKLIGCAIRTDRYRMVAWVNVQDRSAEKIYELYDYQEDPLETINLATTRPDIVAELNEILARHPEVRAQVQK